MVKKKMRKVTPKKKLVAKKKKELKSPGKKILSNKQKKFRLLLLNHDTGLTGTALMRKFNDLHAPNKVNNMFVHRNVTAETIANWEYGDFGQRKQGSGRKKKITEEMEDDIEEWIEDDEIKLKDIPALVKKKFNVQVTAETISNRFKRQKGNPNGYISHVTPLSTPLSKDDEAARLEYALHGPVLNHTFEDFEDICDVLNLPKSWKERRRYLAFWDHKPFYLGKFHRHNARQCRFRGKDGDEEKPLAPGRKEKFSPKFMVFGLLGWSFKESYFHCHRRKNKRRSRDENNNLVYKYTFEHISVNQEELTAAAMTFIPTLKKHGIKVLIGDCDSKLHNTNLAKIFWEHGIFLWPGAGKACGKHPCGYPPRSHDCNPCEPWFSQWQEDAANRMKKKLIKSMWVWKQSLEDALLKMKQGRCQKLIDTQPKVMKTIIANEGGRTKY